MRHLGMLLAVALLAGCADTGRVIFVTTSSFGINVDNKPPTVSIAYDRTEGYIGPRYEDGAIPPVVASIETDGGIFNPRIRQVYATGPAAVRAVGTPNPPESPHEFVGDKKRTVFFGTTTTLGLKAGFGESGPDSFVLGYKRKEFSYIPLGTKSEGGVAHDAYPSVLASIDTTAKVQTQASTALTTVQFFATGWAADTLAGNSKVTSVFEVKAQDALTASMTNAQIEQAKGLANSQREQQGPQVTKVLAFVAPSGTVDTAKLGSLIDQANKTSPNSFSPDFKSLATSDQIRNALQNNIAGTNKLAAAVDALSAQH